MKDNPKLTIHFHPRFPNIYPTSFSGSSAEEFREQYRDAMEELSRYIPKPKTNSVNIIQFVYTLHASDKRTSRLHTGYLLFLNRSPIIFYRNRLLTVE